jgi:hypothetical protein
MILTSSVEINYKKIIILFFNYKVESDLKMFMYPDLSVNLFLTIHINTGLTKRLDSCRRFSLYLRGGTYPFRISTGLTIIFIVGFPWFSSKSREEFWTIHHESFHSLFIIHDQYFNSFDGVALKSVNFIYAFVLTGMFIFNLASQLINGTAAL